MPLIDIHVLESVFTEDEKRRITSETARAFGSVAGIRPNPEASGDTFEDRQADFKRR